jgi:beta-lactam-binding protein with PASTA domain
VAQDPPPDTRTSEVRLLVNRGVDRVTYVMPDLIGVNGERAADLLRARGFRVSIVAQQSAPGIPPGVVIRQTPAGGYQVHPGDAISLEVSQ